MNINKDRRSETHSRHEAVVQVFIREQDPIFDEDGAGSQDEGEEQVHVDVVPGAVELPVQKKKKEKKKTLCFYFHYLFLKSPLESIGTSISTRPNIPLSKWEFTDM